MKSKIQNMFSTRKGTVITIIAAALAMILLSAGAAFAVVAWDVNEERVENAVVEKISPEPVPITAASNPVPETTVAPNPVPETTVAPNTERITAFNEKKITQEEAESIALADAGFGKDQVSHMYGHYEMDDGFHQYEIQFIVGELEYEYAVDAGEGIILERDVEHIYD